MLNIFRSVRPMPSEGSAAPYLFLIVYLYEFSGITRLMFPWLLYVINTHQRIQ